MSTTPDTVTKLYAQLAPAERSTLVLAALARGDLTEADRLGGSCPRKSYTANDAAFVERLAASYDLVAGACADLGHVAGKLFILTLIRDLLDQLLATHRINATLAFFEGERWAKGEPMGAGYAAGPLDGGGEHDDQDEGGDGDDEAAGEAEVEDGDDDDDEGNHADGEPAEPDVELCHRLDAVDRQADAATAWVRRVLTGMADRVAQPFVDTYAAFDRVARRHAGVDGAALARAWHFPHADDLAATRVAFAHVKPDEASVVALEKQLNEAWASRLAEERDDGQ